ncbi:MAG: HYR domain-containing protein, partial [Lewinella sp.]|nr:HYR domain-containing protein [Lewinella sp.]
SDLFQDTDNDPGTLGPFGASAVPDQFTNYTFPFTGTGSTLRYQIVMSSDASEELAFDNICLSGMVGNVAPTLANIEGAALNLTEGDPATAITSTITVSDPDDTNIESATVTFCSGYVIGDDMLAFTNTANITGFFNAATGILNLSGTDTKAAYQAALRSVTYQNLNTTNPTPSRTVCFQVNDGDANSNLEMREITITDLLVPYAEFPVCESFETDGEGVRYNSNTFDDSNNCDFFFRTNTQPSCFINAIGNVDGSYYWASEDVIGSFNGSDPAYVELAPMTVTGLQNLEVSVLLGVSNNAGGTRFETDDALLIQYNLDNGGWTTVGAFYGDNAGGGHLRQDTDLNTVADPAGAILTSTLQNFTFSLGAATGNTLSVRIVIDQNGGSEEIAFDYICASGSCTDSAPPTITCPDPQTGNLDVNCNFQVIDYTSLATTDDDCGSVTVTQSPTAGQTYFGVGPDDIVLTATDGSGNTATCTFTLSMVDNLPPSATCQNLSFNTDPGGCGTNVTLPDPVISDNCGGSPSVSFDPPSGSFFPVGTTNVTVTVMDASTNSTNCVTVVTVNDNVAPTAVCQNTTVQLDATGNASQTAAAVESGSTDNCGTINVVSLSPSAFTCGDVGDNTVTLTVNDGNGNTGTCTATVAVEDNIPPVVQCQNVTVQLDPVTGTTPASPFATGALVSRSDNCQLVGGVSSNGPNPITCGQVGSYFQTTFVRDVNGNVTPCTVEITVQDNTLPSALCQNFTVQLDA